MAKQAITADQLQRICFEALKGRSGFESLNRIEIRARTPVEGGANWTFAPHPRVDTTALRAAREVIEELQRSYELASG
jgi:hypothetical protein